MWRTWRGPDAVIHRYVLPMWRGRFFYQVPIKYFRYMPKASTSWFSRYSLNRLTYRFYMFFCRFALWWLVVCQRWFPFVPIQGPSGGCVRATIEYVADDSSFVLKDLKSVQGVYVNDCHIQNASVRLEPNDILRFVYNGMQYEFLVECPPKVGICVRF